MKTKKIKIILFLPLFLMLAAMWSFSVSADSVCNHEYTNFVYDNNADCVTDGTKSAHCDICNVSIKTIPDPEHPATGHKADEIVKGYAATCSKEGLTDGVKCSICHVFIEEQKVIPTIAHTYSEEYSTIVESTCTVSGVKARKCTVCGQYDLLNQVSIPLKEHSYRVETIKKQTCYSTGSEKWICNSCGKEIIKTIPADAHTLTEWTLTKAPTCSEEGIESAVCTVCSAHKERTVEKTEHTISVLNYVAPTCEENGLTEGQVCSVCHETIVARTSIPALGHDYYIEADITAPTCTSKGKGHQYCRNDPTYSLVVFIDKIPHEDADENGFCDSCSVTMKVQTCGCFCHNDTFISRIVRYFDTLLSKLFKKDFRCCEDMEPYNS